MGFCHLQDIYPLNMKKNLLDTATKAGLNDGKKMLSKK